MSNNTALNSANSVIDLVKAGYALENKSKYQFTELTRFHELMVINNCAIKEVQTKLEILNDELTMRHGNSCIESIHSRLKKPASIIKKLEKRGLEVSVESIEENLTDVAGLRVICSFVDNIYEVADMLISQDDVTLVEMKDYIENPKPNGYRSLHLIVEVPVYFSDNKQSIKVEIQIRTMAMDFWASLEHQLRYKNDTGNVINIDYGEIIAELRECSEVIAQTDLKMQQIRNKIESINDVDSYGNIR